MVKHKVLGLLMVMGGEGKCEPVGGITVEKMYAENS